MTSIGQALLSLLTESPDVWQCMPSVEGLRHVRFPIFLGKSAVSNHVILIIDGEISQILSDDDQVALYRQLSTMMEQHIAIEHERQRQRVAELLGLPAS